MNNNHVLSTFQMNWVVKAIPFKLHYRQASATTKLDSIFCTILNEKGGSIKYYKLANLLGFNVTSDQSLSHYGDSSENKIFEYYLNQLSQFHLIVRRENTLEITAAGIACLQTDLKYKYYSAFINLYKNVTAREDEALLFPFNDAFNLNNLIFSKNEVKPLDGINEDSISNKINFQLFQNDIFKGELLSYKIRDLQEHFQNIDLKVSFIINEESKKSIHFEHYENESTAIDNLVVETENSKLKEQLIREGEFHHYLNLHKPINSTIIMKFIDLWDWEKLAANSNMVWTDDKVFEVFSTNSDKSVWRIISSNVSQKDIINVLDRFVYFWDWCTLSNRFDEAFIEENIAQYPWDFEIISRKNQGLVLKLLKDNELIKEGWDWSFLSQELPEKFIVENIGIYPWDYYGFTSNRFDIFKKVFNNAFTKGSTEILLKGWNWEYISEEININVAYKYLDTFAPFIKWDIILRRFFTDKDILKKCLSDPAFKATLKNLLPDNFIINVQEYNWSKELISFFDGLHIIQWETENFIDGLDTNKSLVWNQEIFEVFHQKIKTQKGVSSVSSQISDSNLIFKYSDFNWDWDAISENITLIKDESFLLKVLSSNNNINEKLNWDVIFDQRNISFWNSNLNNIKSEISKDEHPVFFEKLSAAQEFKFIVSRYNFKWDWNYLSNNVPIENIIGSLKIDHLRPLWNWKVITPRFDKAEVYNNLEELCAFWDWPYLIGDLFNYKIDLNLENGGLHRIAKCVSSLPEQKQTETWKILTNVYPVEVLFTYIEETKDNDIFNWNWKVISANKHLKVDLVSINSLRSKLDWEIFSDNPAINRIFDRKEDWKNFGEYFQYVKKYLDYFLDDWDWKILSRNPSLNWNRSILENYIDQNWDWSFLSEYGKFIIKSKKDSDNYLTKLLAKFPNIELALVSSRKDITIHQSTLIETEKLKWNWKELSDNPIVELDGNTLIILHNKDWDWEILSSRTDIDISNELLLELHNKEWNWQELSLVKELNFNQDFITNLIDKPWDWQQISRHKSFIPTQTLLPKLKRFDLDWNHISQHQEFPVNRETLSNFKEKLNWSSITKHPNLDVSRIDIISEFKDYLDWAYLSADSNLSLNEDVLYEFQEYLDWQSLSANTGIQFNKNIVLKFEEKWNWNKLSNNNKVKEVLGDFVETKLASSPQLKFISKIDEQNSFWKNSIYHFTHIENAVEILKNRRIQSRNKAQILGDAAGNVVNLRNDAHAYARFYFRPHTPTQFYNEFLGKDKNDGYENREGNWVSWYEKSRGLGFPKCPIPIFFRFPLDEIIFDKSLTSCVSNGNMQTKSTKFGSIAEMINNFEYQDLYYTPQQYATKDNYRVYREYSQQEFLIQDELKFDKFKNFEVVCATEFDKILLKNMLGCDHQDVFLKIIVDPSYYNFENVRVDVELLEDSINISSGFKGDGVFSFETTSTLNKSDIYEGNVQSLNSSKILFKSHLSLSNIKDPFKIKFIDESDREWVIYKSNKTRKKTSISIDSVETVSLKGWLKKYPEFESTYNTKVRHYKLYDHTNIVCEQFEKYFQKDFKLLDKNLFRLFLILHDIGKPQAHSQGERYLQHKYTQNLIKSFGEKAQIPKNHLKLLISLASGDYLGAYFQNKISPKQVKINLELISNDLSYDLKTVFQLFLIYYQCDTASYTEDAGGIKFLEYMFEYSEGNKVFDETEMILRFTEQYWNKYLILKSIIYNVH